MGAVEELKGLCGRFCWRWKDSKMQEKEIKEHWFLTWRKPSIGGQSSSCVGLGDAFQISKADLRVLCDSNTSGEFSL